MRKIITLSIISAVLEPRFKALRCWLQNLKRLHFPSTDSASLTSLPQWSQISDWTGARPWLEDSRPLWRWTPLFLMLRCASWAHRAGSFGACVCYQMKNTFPQEKSEITAPISEDHTSSWWCPAGVVPPIALLPVSLVYLPRLKSHQAPRLKDDWPLHDSMNQFLFVECPNSCKALCSWWHAPASLQISWNCTELCVVKFNSIWPWNRVHGYQSVYEGTINPQNPKAYGNQNNKKIK